MPDIDVETLAENATLIGLITREQAVEARSEAQDGTMEALTRVMLRKGMLTGWQLEKLKKGEPNGFFFGGCKVLFHIAEGTFARVYRGQRLSDRSPVAVKVLRQRFIADKEAVVRFHKEAEAGLKLKHQNIVQIQEYGEQDKRHYMIMEYVEGSNLRDFLKIRTYLTTREALPLLLGLARGLKYSLDQGVTHRDIKGTNILIASSGVAKLVDFGLATIEGDDKKEDKKMAVAHGQRTVDYSALERTCGSPKGDPRSDIYFLGCVYYQMLTGQLAMPEVESKDPLAKMLKRSFGAIKPLSDQRLAPDPELTRIIEKMMKMDLKARYQTMDEVVNDLEAYEATAKSSLVAAAAAPASPAAPADADEPEESQIGDDEEIFMVRGDDAQPFQPGAFEVKTIQPKNLLCVESQDAIQEVFRTTFSKMGYSVSLFSDPQRAAEQFRETPADAVIFDADGLGPGAVKAFLGMLEQATDDGQDLAALVLLGPKQGALREELPDDKRLVVLSKPVKMKQVQDAIAQLVPIA